jgi:hypothetical protein
MPRSAALATGCPQQGAALAPAAQFSRASFIMDALADAERVSGATGEEETR